MKQKVTGIKKAGTKRPIGRVADQSKPKLKKTVMRTPIGVDEDDNTFFRVCAARKFGNIPVLDKHIVSMARKLGVHSRALGPYYRFQSKLDKLFYRNLTDCRIAVAIDKGLHPSMVTYKIVNVSK